MNTDITHSLPFPRNWSAQDLADAIPRRLSDLITPELMRFERKDEAANGVALAPWAFDWRRHDRDEPLFRVR
ncbi:hypothetical protein [Lysobacter tyrosinilyticus]